MQLVQRVLIIAFLLCANSFAVVINSTSIVGNQITITGSGFSGVPLSVTFNGQSIPIISNIATQIVAQLPSIAPGTYRVSVTSGRVSSSAYASVPAPSILFGECYDSSYIGYWVWLFGGGQNCETGAHYPPGAGIPVTSAGVLSNLRAAGNFTGTVTLWVNDVQTALSCTITDPHVRACSDLTDQVQVNAGDALALGINNTGSVFGARAALEFRAK